MSQIKRRNFLKSGALALTIPFLESLPQFGWTQTASGSLKRIVYITFSNAFHHDVVFPTLTNYQVGPENVRYIPLSSITGDVSQVFTNAKYGNIKAKMNLIRGMDLPVADGLGGHHTGMPLGANTGEADSTTTIDAMIGADDQFKASFKRNVNIIPVTDFESKYSMSSIGATMGPRQLLDLFTNLPSSGTTPPPVVVTPTDVNINRRLAMTTALGDLNTLASSSRLAASEKIILSNHADMMNRLIKNLAPPTTTPSPTPPAAVGVCSKPVLASGIDESMNASSSANNTARIRAVMDMIYMAFNCQRTNVITLHPTVAGFEDGILPMGDAPNDNYHQMAGHKLPSEYSAARYLKAKNWLFDQVLYLVNLMNNTRESNGLTMLDNSLVVVMTNDGMSVHSTLDMPIITFGSLGGAIKTGNYINYQRADLSPFSVGGWNSGPSHTITYGRPLNSFHTTILKAFNIPIPAAGFGNYGSSGNHAAFVTAAAKQASLPVLT